MNSLQKQLNELKVENQEALTQLSQQNQQNADAASHVAALQTEVDQVAQSVDALTQTITTLSTQMAQISAQEQLREHAAEIKKQQDLADLRTQKKYFVVAVIPGRAWLKGADGSSISVAVGDNLDGYGKILNIDPYNGQVQTSVGTLNYATQ